MKVLVTGGAGFIGSHTLEKLQKENFQVVVIDNLSSGCRANVPYNVKFIEMDICSNDLVNVFKVEKFDYVIHLAAQTMVSTSLKKPGFDCKVNIAGIVNVLEACRKTGVKRIVFSSSAAVYGDVKHVPISESITTEPTSFYGLSKLTSEKYLDLYHKIYGLEYVALRYANVYGERQGDSGEGGVISIFNHRVCQDKELIVYGDGSQTRDFVYAGDVAAANWFALTTPNVNDVYNISTQNETSVKDLIGIIARISGKVIKVKYASSRKGDIHRSTLANKKANEKLNWTPEVSLSDGLQKAYNWFCTKTRG